MKYRTNTILTGSFFLIVFTGLAIAHFQAEAEKSELITEAEPLELHTIMRMLLIDIHTIIEGIYTENYDLIVQGAHNINNHPPLAPESRQLVQETLGERMLQFGAYDEVVHRHADSLRFAAIDKDMGRIRDHYRIIEQGCVSCHVSFQNEIKRERIVSSGESEKVMP